MIAHADFDPHGVVPDSVITQKHRMTAHCGSGRYGPAGAGRWLQHLASTLADALSATLMVCATASFSLLCSGFLEPPLPQPMR